MVTTTKLVYLDQCDVSSALWKSNRSKLLYHNRYTHQMTTKLYDGNRKRNVLFVTKLERGQTIRIPQSAVTWIPVSTEAVRQTWTQVTKPLTKNWYNGRPKDTVYEGNFRTQEQAKRLSLRGNLWHLVYNIIFVIQCGQNKNSAKPCTDTSKRWRPVNHTLNTKKWLTAFVHANQICFIMIMVIMWQNHHFVLITTCEKVIVKPLVTQTG